MPFEKKAISRLPRTIHSMIDKERQKLCSEIRYTQRLAAAQGYGDVLIRSALWLLF